MSLRDLVDPECGGANQLVRLGNQITRDHTYKDEGFSGAPQSALPGRPVFNSEQLINDFMAQVSNVAPPQSFRMDNLLKEMRDIDAQSFGRPVVPAPPVIQEVNRSEMWSKDFMDHQRHIFEPDKAAGGSREPVWTPRMPPGMMTEGFLPPLQNPNANVAWTKDFFDSAEKADREKAKGSHPTAEEQEELRRAADDLLNTMGSDSDPFQYSEFVDFMKNVSEDPSVLNMGEQGKVTEDFHRLGDQEATDDWAKDYAENMREEADKKDEYNQQFWNRLQDEWRKIAEENDDHHPWLSEFQDFYDPYKEYKFDEDNPMTNDENVFEKGKAFLAQGDSSSAALCFESAAKQDPSNAECWELLGRAQAENEKDPHAIAALKRALELKPDNMQVMMALAVSYTNEGLQTQALRMLINWMKLHPKYSHLVPQNMADSEEGAVGVSIAKPPYLADVQDLFLAAVRMNPSTIDTDVQEALGVLFNLSADYDKAVDCFEAVVKMCPDNPKAWNRLGASLANGNRSVEAVDAYQRALAIHPGFIRARYNVGIICINLKAYKEAAEHLLTALNHQATSSARSGIVRDASYKQMSNGIWSTLRMAVSLLGRHDLQPAIDRKDLDAMNSAFEMNDV